MSPRWKWPLSLLLSLAVAAPSAGTAYSQVRRAWTATYDGPGMALDAPSAVAVDREGNVLVTGFSNSSSTPSASLFATVKLSPEGGMLWVASYGKPFCKNEAKALAVDAGGNVYVTGSTSTASAGDSDYATVKYSREGKELWAQLYDGPDNKGDIPCSIAVDATGNVVVTGNSKGIKATDCDYATVKYSPEGKELWVRRYDGPGSGNDAAKGIAVDAAGNVIVTGESDGGAETDLDFATVKYAPGGQELWVRRYDGAGTGSDRPCGLAVDAAGNICVAGESFAGDATDSDYAIVKYAPDGTVLWSRRWNGSESLDDVPRAMALDGASNILLTGESLGSSATRSDFATVKYAPDGTELWARRYDGPSHGLDKPIGIAVDAAGNVHVTGASQGVVTGLDWATVKYDPDGNELWVNRHGDESFNMETPTAVTLDGAGNVLVAGEVSSDVLYAILKYDRLGRRLWYRQQAASIADISAGLEGEIHVTGRLVADYATLKYESVPIKRGYIDANDKVEITDAIVLLQHLFLGGDAPPCLDAADIDDSGELNLTDPIRLLSHLFLGGMGPEEPFAQCGRDVTLDSLECNVHPSCDLLDGIPLFTFYGQDFEADGVFYVIDKSGSMQDSGELMIAKREILRNVVDFPESMEFGIVFFDASVSKFPSSGMPAKAIPEMKASATAYVGSVVGGAGSCCGQGLAAGLQYASQSAAKRKVLIFLGDGGGTCQGADENTYLRQTLAAITAMNNQEVQIHCIGVLNPSSLGVDFMKRLAAANGGTYTRIVR